MTDGGAPSDSDDGLLDPGLAIAFAPHPPSTIGESVLDSLERLPGAVSSPSPAKAPADAGRYRVGREIGRGGAGVVYEGYDRDLDRDVAIKLLRPDRACDPRFVERFVEEARIESELEHSGVAPIYDLGFVHGGLPFFAMRLVRGRPLCDLLRARADVHADQRRFLGILAQVCRTVAHAHARGLVHRDLKPPNVMVGEFGEVCVVDWGLARVVAPRDTAPSEGSQPTEPGPPESTEGGVFGTVAYMPPEQARGDLANVTQRSDVFALGAILTEILTGVPPHAGGRAADLLLAARGDIDATRQRLAACGADADLVALALHCLAADAASRPPDAGAVASALETHLRAAEERAQRAAVDAAADRARREVEEERERVEVRRAAWERAARRRTVAIASAVVVAVLLAGGFALRRQAADEARAEAAASAVDEALAEVSRAQGEGDAVRAESFARRAVDLAHVEGAGPAVASRAADALERTRAVLQVALARERDTRLLLALDRADRVRRSGQGASEAEAAYRAAFHERGIDADSMPADRIVAALRGTVAPADLAAGLEGWALLLQRRVGSTEASWRPLVEAARSLAPDPWRARLLDAALAGDRAGFRDVALAAQSQDVPLRTLHLVCELLSLREQQDLARPILLAAWRRHPDDLRLNGILTVALGGWLVPTYVGGRRDLKPVEAVRFALARAALRPDDGAGWSDLGRALDLAGEREAAERACRRAIALAGEKAGVSYHNALGDVLLRQGRAEEAVAEFLVALRIRPDLTGTLYRLGFAYRALGRYDEALDVVDRGIAIDPSDGVLLAARGDTLRALGRSQDAVDSYRKGIERNRILFPAYSRLAILLDSEGRSAEALAVLREGVAAVPEEPTLLHNLGTLLIRMGKVEEAIPILRRCAEIDPSDPETFMGLGNAYDSLGREEEAKAAFRQVLVLDPRHAGARANLSYFLFTSGDIEGALAELRLAVAADPRMMEAWFYIGQAQQRAGRHAEAVEALRRAEALAPQDPQIQQLLGISLCDGLHDYPAAIVAFRKVIAVDPKNATVLVSLAHALRSHGDFVAAADACRAALAADPSYARAGRDLGIALYLAEDWAGAAEAARAALAREPDDAPTAMLLAWMLAVDGDPARRRPEEALALLDRVAPQAAGQPLFAAARGVALLRLGRVEEALALLEPAADAGEPAGKIALAAALARTGRKAEARAVAAAAEKELTKLPPSPRKEVDDLRAMLSEALGAEGGR